MREQGKRRRVAAFARLLLAVMTAGLCAEVYAIRIQPPPDLACGQGQVELVAGSIAEVEQVTEVLWVTVLTEWGTLERIRLDLTSTVRTKRVSLRSALQTTDLIAWLKQQGQDSSVRIWQCSEPQLQLWEILGEKLG